MFGKGRGGGGGAEEDGQRRRKAATGASFSPPEVLPVSGVIGFWRVDCKYRNGGKRGSSTARCPVR